MSVRYIDLFAGAGGLSLGLAIAGFETACAVEYDTHAAATFSAHAVRADVICDDIQNVDLTSYLGRIDVVCGGPPCQPFSSGGLRGSHRDERDMIPWFISIVDQLRPAAFLMENVPGLTVGDRAPYLQQVLHAFSECGYHVTWQVLNAADYGVPQIRRRLFIVGMRAGPFVFPVPTHGPRRALPYVTVDDVLPRHQIGAPNIAKVTYARTPDLRPSPYHGQLFNGGGRPINRSQPAPTILASAGGNKTHFFDDHDLVLPYHAYLMSGGRPKEGVLPGARRLTVEESAILQTFSTTVKFAGPRSAQYRQIGNAVPPALATVLGRAIALQLDHAESIGDGGGPREFVVQASLFPSTKTSLRTMAKRSARNESVERAVRRILDRIDYFLGGEPLSKLPDPQYRREADTLIKASASILTASMFLTFYKLEQPDYTFERVPEGARGGFGDKLLCDQLTQRSITLHNGITAPFENIGSKGAVDNFRPLSDRRCGDFLTAIASAPIDQVEAVGDYLAEKYAASQRIISPLPPVGANVLTFARAKALFHRLIGLTSQGYFPQFLAAALLTEFRRKQSIEVRTHQVHAADRYDGTAGDIEEFFEGQLHRAYEVTTRPDWQNRLSDFKDKMDRYQLRKYVIIAANVNNNPEWSEPAHLALKLKPYGRDIAVLDINDFLNYMAAELPAVELREAVNNVYQMLAHKKLCGRPELMELYNQTVSEWLDESV